MLRAKLRTRNIVFSIIALLLLVAVGYAIIATDLKIKGSVVVDKITWDIHFENIVLDDENTVEGTTELKEKATILNYAVAFKKPGDYYSFTVDVVNAGALDAVISSIEENGLTDSQKEFINYSLTYQNGLPVKEKDSLKAGERQTLVVIVEYKYDIGIENLLDSDTIVDLTLQIDFSQDDKIVPIQPKPAYFVKDAVLDNIQSQYVSSSTGVDFSQISSDTNGKGLYIKSGTEDSAYPIYYYRGAVDNNNVIFAGFCWKIVRTTETGGTKLIYNGTPNDNGECVTQTGYQTQTGYSYYNSGDSHITNSGYMYGKYISGGDVFTTATYLYGNTFVYERGLYTLKNTVEVSMANDPDDQVIANLSNHHYTCENSSGTCSELYYFYYNIGNSGASYVKLTGGQSIEDAINDMRANTNDSNLKKAVDNWFNNTFNTYFTNLNKDYNDYLEDTVWCNDKSMNTLGTDNTKISNGWISTNGVISNYLYYSTNGRVSTASPSLACSNKNDSFTVAESDNGNGALTYPVGLLTSDEVLLAGGQNEDNTSFYLYTGSNWLTMSPSDHYSKTLNVYLVDSNGNFAPVSSKKTTYGVRPSISIKYGVKMADGRDGTSTNPYEFVIE